jgi:hypothetical protein
MILKSRDPFKSLLVPGQNKWRENEKREDFLIEATL